MMKLTLSRDPYRTMKRFQNMMNDDFFSVDWDETEIDMYEKGDNIVVELKAPGFDDKSIDISIEDNTLTITGVMENIEEEQNKERKYYKKEIRTESFSRSVTLPTRIEAESASANFKNGILHLTLPKAEEVKPKKIKVGIND